jgi:hypothetical protein
MTRTSLALLAVVAVGATGSPALADGTLLAGDALRQAVSGKRIYLSVPLGGQLPLYYRPDGRVDGTGEAAGLGRYLKPTDSGRWWVQEERLCQKWQAWYNGRTFCFTVRDLGNNRIAWLRDDGEKGIARIGQ